MKIITVIFIFLSLTSFGQSKSFPNNTDTTNFHLSPSENHIVINGCSFGLSLQPWSYQDTCYTKLNGLNIELGPLGLVGGIYGLAFGIGGINNAVAYVPSIFSNRGYADSTFHSKYGTYVNGLSVSIFGMSDTFNNGLIINGLSGYTNTTSGIQISGLLNNMYSFKGVSIAAIGNTANKAKGLQIGLINKCKTGQVIQIGLFNRIGKRVTPIINFRFRKDKKSPASPSVTTAAANL